MASQSSSSLPEVIRHYGEVAEMVNNREMKRFISVIRSRWNPPSHEDEYRFEGWTDEGALTKCIYETAFYSHDRPQLVPDPNGTDAEVNEQVQIKPSLDEIMDFVPKPLILPALSEDRRRTILETIKTGMERQVMTSGIDATALEVPKDLDILLSTVKGIRGAGVPAETAYTELIREWEGNWVPEKMPYDVVIRSEGWQPLDGSLPPPNRHVPVAALHLGGCEQHRSIYYVLTLPKNSTNISSEAKWQIWDRINIEVEHYDNLVEWLQHETEEIKKNEGGGQRELVLMYDRYPV